MKSIREICHSRGCDSDRAVGLPLNLSYKSTLALIEHLKACDEVACTRTANWQIFCLEEKTTLPYLFQIVFLLDEGLAPLILQLVQVALSGIPPEKEQHKKESGGGGGGKKSGRHESRKEGKETNQNKSQSKETKESKPTTPTPCSFAEHLSVCTTVATSLLNLSLCMCCVCTFIDHCTV
jgi:E3 ubiquitin-protein ligase UBR4